MYICLLAFSLLLLLPLPAINIKNLSHAAHEECFERARARARETAQRKKQAVGVVDDDDEDYDDECGNDRRKKFTDNAGLKARVLCTHAHLRVLL